MVLAAHQGFQAAVAVRSQTVRLFSSCLPRSTHTPASGGALQRGGRKGHPCIRPVPSQPVPPPPPPPAPRRAPPSHAHPVPRLGHTRAASQAQRAAPVGTLTAATTLAAAAHTPRRRPRALAPIPHHWLRLTHLPRPAAATPRHPTHPTHAPPAEAVALAAAAVVARRAGGAQRAPRPAPPPPPVARRRARVTRRRRGGAVGRRSTRGAGARKRGPRRRPRARAVVEPHHGGDNGGGRYVRGDHPRPRDGEGGQPGEHHIPVGRRRCRAECLVRRRHDRVAQQPRHRCVQNRVEGGRQQRLVHVECPRNGPRRRVGAAQRHAQLPPPRGVPPARRVHAGPHTSRQGGHQHGVLVALEQHHPLARRGERAHRHGPVRRGHHVGRQRLERRRQRRRPHLIRRPVVPVAAELDDHHLGRVGGHKGGHVRNDHRQGHQVPPVGGPDGAAAVTEAEVQEADARVQLRPHRRHLRQRPRLAHRHARGFQDVGRRVAARRPVGAQQPRQGVCRRQRRRRVGCRVVRAGERQVGEARVGVGGHPAGHGGGPRRRRRRRRGRRHQPRGRGGGDGGAKRHPPVGLPARRHAGERGGGRTSQPESGKEARGGEGG
ncbi:hypothetical protein I4F81_011149 [Pyropia yezoensis]|uniref:Uncharacterized protein n=1 Tax=Pyropia yezoensis TaxID=2788 RepID=A0ACC3CEM0_PYRYE|nr:hypothetical protein I4F81_011149 [Neopyropia yezoensis]